MQALGQQPAPPVGIIWMFYRMTSEGRRRMMQPMTTPAAWYVVWETWCGMPPADCDQLWVCLPPWA
jgi:hypothetical protein